MVVRFTSRGAALALLLVLALAGCAPPGGRPQGGPSTTTTLRPTGGFFSTLHVPGGAPLLFNDQSSSGPAFDGGLSANRIGDSIFFSDGVSAQRYGDVTYFSDGRSASVSGDAAYFSDGRICRRIGLSLSCF